jgi:hypothetical protein
MKKFILQHWRGEFSLPLAYWGISVLFVGLIRIIAEVLTGELESSSTSLTSTAWILFGFYAFTYVIICWSLIGTWRSATRYSLEKKSSLWSGLAKLAIALGVLQISSTFLIKEAPVLKVMSAFLMGSNASTRINVEILDDGKTIKLSGMFGNGSFNTFKTSLDKNPNINRIFLSSNGGLFKEVSLIAEEILIKRLDTYVEDKCESFCTIVFLSGYNRFSTPNAKIGFHSPALKGFSDSDGELHIESKKLYAKLRVSKEFIDKIYSTPNSDVWYPTHKELVDAGIVNKVTLGGETNSLGGFFNKNKNELYDAFLKIELYSLYEKKFPGTINKVIEIIMPMAKAGKTDSEILNATREYVTTLTLKAVAKSTPEIRTRFISLSAKQSREASKIGNEACYKLLTTTLDVTKVFPKELVDEELNLIKDALNSSYIAPVGYREVLYEQLLQTALTSLSDSELSTVTSPSLNNKNNCSSITKFYEAIEKLPRQSKDIVAYGLFSG